MARDAEACGEDTIDLVVLRWIVSHLNVGESTCPLFIETLRRLIPSALPIRFGNTEPLRGKATPEDSRPFIDKWKELLQASDKISAVLGNHLFFRSTPPCIGGSISIPPRPEPYEKPDEFDPRYEFELNFDWSAFRANEPGSEQIANLFLELSTLLGAYHAHAYVERGYGKERRGLFVARNTEVYLVPAGPKWIGLPPVPTWLAWYGKTYSGLLEHQVAAPVGTRHGDGRFLRLSSVPLPVEELLAKAPKLRPELLAKVENSSTREYRSSPSQRPAEMIPGRSGRTRPKGGLAPGPYTEIRLPDVAGRVREVPKKLAKEYGAWLQGSIPARAEALRAVVTGTPGYEDWKLDFSPGSLEALGDWFEDQIRSDDSLPSEEVFKKARRGGDLPQLPSRVVSLAVDIGLYLGEVMRRNLAGSTWTQILKGSKRRVEYGAPVIEAGGVMVLDPLSLVGGIAFRIGERDWTGKRLRELYDVWHHELPKRLRK